MENIYYFAFGSNLLSERLRERVGDAKKIGTALLPDYKLVFNCGWKKNSFANIKRCEGSVVEGVVYELDDYQIHWLDLYEGYPNNYEKFWFVDKGKILFGYWSVNPNFKSAANPSPHYLKYLTDGALENNLTNTYNFLIEYERIISRQRHFLSRLF